MRIFERGYSSKILIYPGIYREQIVMRFSVRSNNPPIILEAKEKGKVFISGSDVWTAWQPTGRGNVFAHPWPYRWGFQPYPPGWQGNVTLQPIVQRREMVFVNGRQLRQVMTYSDLTEETFYVSEETGRLFISLSKGQAPSDVKIEVGVRNTLLHVEGKTNFVMAGLTFQHAVSGIEGNAVVVYKSTNVLVKDCIFQWNNWTGYRLHDDRNVTTMRNLSNYNGGTGLTAWKVKSLLSEDDETSYNNWRGKVGQFYYWAVSGTKNMRIHDAVFRRHKARGNHAAGFWLDYDNQNVMLEENLWCGNLKHGLFIEVTQGPVSVEKNKVYGNQEWGIRAIAARAITLIGNEIFNNAGQQILLTGPLEREIDNWETQERISLRMEGWTLRDNVIAGSYTLLETKDWPRFLESLISEANAWRKPYPAGVFRIGANALSFEDWQLATRQDSSSVFFTGGSSREEGSECVYQG
jgi:parallel beta-helix repeat protein